MENIHIKFIGSVLTKERTVQSDQDQRFLMTLKCHGTPSIDRVYIANDVVNVILFSWGIHLVHIKNIDHILFVRKKRVNISCNKVNVEISSLIIGIIFDHRSKTVQNSRKSWFDSITQIGPFNLYDISTILCCAICKMMSSFLCSLNLINFSLAVKQYNRLISSVCLLIFLKIRWKWMHRKQVKSRSVSCLSADSNRM